MWSSLKLTSITAIDKEESKKLTIIINCLNESNDSFDFREPVDWKGMGLTDYPSIIKHPMDLWTIGRKIKDEKYEKVEEVLDDIQLIWDNCKTYNPDNSWIHSIAQKLERSFKKMVKNYFPDLNINIPIKMQEEDDNKGPSLYQQQGEDITYQQKLKFSEELSFLPSLHLAKIIDQVIDKCPAAYKDQGDGKGQILVDNMDLIFFNQISMQGSPYLRMVRNMLNDTQEMQIQDDKPKKIRGRPPVSPK